MASVYYNGNAVDTTTKDLLTGDLLNKIVLKDKFYEIFEDLGLDYPETYVYECGKENDLKFNFKY